MKKMGFAHRAMLAILCWAMVTASAGAMEYSLSDLSRIALNRSEKLKIAEETLGIAEIGKDKAVSYLYPRVTATGNATEYSEKKLNATGSVIQPNSATSWGVRLDETLSLSGREWTALDISKQTVAKGQHDLTTVREDYLLRQVAAPYFNVLLVKKNLEIADNNVERLQAQRNAAEVRLKVGEVTKTALLRADSELSGAKADQVQAQNALALALAILANNCSLATGSVGVKERPPALDEVMELAAFQEKALKNRTELKGLAVQKEIAAGQVKYAEGAFWPSLTLSGVYAGADQNPASSNLNRESIYGGASLNFPFFEGGLRKAELTEAKARERQAILNYEDLRNAIDIEVRTAYLDMLTQQGILQFLKDQLAYARDNYQAVARQFEFGLSNSLDVMDANSLLVSAERKWASALCNDQLARLKMKRATGTLLDTLLQTH